MSYERFIAFGIFWFFITLSVESSIIPIKDVIFEHRVYLPFIGAVIAITTSTLIAKNKLAGKQLRMVKTIIPILVLMTTVFSVATYERNIVWQDKVSLWSDVVRKSPSKSRGYKNLGSAYREKGFINKAMEQFQAALKLDTNYANAYNFLGSVYGSVDEAIEHYQAFLKLKPDDAAAHNDLGSLYRYKGFIEKAVEHYHIALKLNPDYALAHYNLGIIYMKIGLEKEAISEFEAVLKIQPAFGEVRQVLESLTKYR